MAFASSILDRSQASPASVEEIQREMAEIFADLADLFGNPASIGAIYGLLFASTEPLSMEEIVEKIGISTGTASQGLRRLVELEAIVPQKSDGERVTRLLGAALTEGLTAAVQAAKAVSEPPAPSSSR